MRKYIKSSPNHEVGLVDIVCDCCGESTKHGPTFDRAVLAADFANGDMFMVEMCRECFDDFMETLLSDYGGSCVFSNKFNKERTIEDIMSEFENRAERRAILMPSEGEEEEEEEETETGDEQ